MSEPKLNRKQQREQKIEWMLAHRTLWNHVEDLRYVSSGRPPLYMSDRSTWRAVADGLKDAGLISRKTGTIDVPVRELIQTARERIEIQRTDK